jgi:O-antigen/teichoic acid export membrane protein
MVAVSPTLIILTAIGVVLLPIVAAYMTNRRLERGRSRDSNVTTKGDN